MIYDLKSRALDSNSYTLFFILLDGSPMLNLLNLNLARDLTYEYFEEFIFVMIYLLIENFCSLIEFVGTQDLIHMSQA